MSQTGTLSARDKRVKDYIYKGLKLTNVRAVVKEQNADWSTEQLNDAERWYRNFLWLAYRRGTKGQILGIEKRADQFWHAHVLYTEDYAEACRKILGKRGFIHHRPPRNAKQLNERVVKASEKAYRKEFPDEFLVLISIGPFDIPCLLHIIFG